MAESVWNKCEYWPTDSRSWHDAPKDGDAVTYDVSVGRELIAGFHRQLDETILRGLHPREWLWYVDPIEGIVRYQA